MPNLDNVCTDNMNSYYDENVSNNSEVSDTHVESNCGKINNSDSIQMTQDDVETKDVTKRDIILFLSDWKKDLQGVIK